jgi:hypothetical protein
MEKEESLENDKVNKAYVKVHLQTIMPKLQKLRQNRNRLFAHIFEYKTSNVNLDLQVQILTQLR